MCDANDLYLCVQIIFKQERLLVQKENKVGKARECKVKTWKDDLEVRNGGGRGSEAQNSLVLES